MEYLERINKLVRLRSSDVVLTVPYGEDNIARFDAVIGEALKHADGVRYMRVMYLSFGTVAILRKGGKIVAPIYKDNQGRTWKLLMSTLEGFVDEEASFDE